MSVTQYEFWKEMASACEKQAQWFAYNRMMPANCDMICELYQTLQMICTAIGNQHKPMDEPPIGGVIDRD